MVVGTAIFRTSRQRTTSRSPRQRFSVGRWLKRRLSDKSAPNSREFLLQPDSSPSPVCFCNQLRCAIAIAIDFIAHDTTQRTMDRNGKKNYRGGGRKKRDAGNRASESGKLIRIIENVTNLFAGCWLISRMPNVANSPIFRSTLRLSLHEVNDKKKRVPKFIRHAIKYLYIKTGIDSCICYFNYTYLYILLFAILYIYRKYIIFIKILI